MGVNMLLMMMSVKNTVIVAILMNVEIVIEVVIKIILWQKDNA